MRKFYKREIVLNSVHKEVQRDKILATSKMDDGDKHRVKPGITAKSESNPIDV
jgi:hypothetical protein